MVIIEQEHAWNAEKQIRYNLLYRLQLFILQGNVRRVVADDRGVGSFWAIVFKSFIGPSTETNANYGFVQC